MVGRGGAPWSARRRWLGALALSLYALVLSVGPVLHHEPACHIKLPAHCDACAANPLASRVEAGMRLDAPPLPAAGEAPSCAQPREQAIPVTPASGRSPPA